MGSYKFLNVTKSQYYHYPSSTVDEDGITILLSLFKSGIWEATDEIVHGSNGLLRNEDGDWVQYSQQTMFTPVVLPKSKSKEELEQEDSAFCQSYYQEFLEEKP